MPRRRLGVALVLSAPLSIEVEGLRRGLGDGALGRVVPHITLVPPVNVHVDRIPDALKVLRVAAAKTAPFTIGLGPVATFHPDNPVLYLAVDDRGGAVQALRDRVFTEPLARDLTWPFIPHVTICDGADPELIPGAVASLQSFRATVTFERVHILEERDGHIWRPIADATFEARRIVGRGGIELELTVSDALDAEAQAFNDAAWSDMHQAPTGSDTERVFAITARRDGAIVGTADGHTFGDTAYLANLIVDAAVRGEGIGAHLLAAFESLAAERACTHVTLRTADGDPAQTFYERHGWRVTGKLPAFRRNRDFVAMRRELGGSA